MDIKEIQLSKRRVQAVLHCIETQRNIAQDNEYLDDETQKRLDVALQGLKDDISGMSRVEEERLFGVLED